MNPCLMEADRKHAEPYPRKEMAEKRTTTTFNSATIDQIYVGAPFGSVLFRYPPAWLGLKIHGEASKREWQL